MLFPVQNSAAEKQLQRPRLGRTATEVPTGFENGDSVGASKSYTPGKEPEVSTSKRSRASRGRAHVRERCGAGQIVLVVSTSLPRCSVVRSCIFPSVEGCSTKETSTQGNSDGRMPYTASAEHSLLSDSCSNPSTAWSGAKRRPEAVLSNEPSVTYAHVLDGLARSIGLERKRR